MASNSIRIISLFFTALFASSGIAVILSILKIPGIFIIFLICFVSLLIWQSYCSTPRKMWIRSFFIIGAESILTPIVLFFTIAQKMTSTQAPGEQLGTLFAGTILVGMAAVIGVALGILFITIGFILKRRTPQ